MWNTFRTCGRDDQQGAVAGTYLAEHFKDKRIAFVHDKTPYGKGLADETLKALKAKGGAAVLVEGINPGEKDYSALVSKLKSANVDARLLRRLPHRGRADPAADARPGPQGDPWPAATASPTRNSCRSPVRPPRAR